MTALRPERDSAAPYGEDSVYGGAAAFEAQGDFEGAAAFDASRDFGTSGDARTRGAMRAAVDGLADPLSDPLPGQRQPTAPEQEWHDQGHPRDWSAEQTASSYAKPARRAHAKPSHMYAERQPQPSYAEPQPQPPEPQPSYDEAYSRPGTQSYSPSYEPSSYEPSSPVDEETVALRMADAEATGGAPTSPVASPTGPAAGGRAARRKASSRRHRRRGGAGGASGRQEGPTEPGASLSRVEARRAARARKPGAAVVASRAIGEVFITTGVLMLLFVTYQLWWTNVWAHAQAGNEVSTLKGDWSSGKRSPGAFESGQGFALLHIPKLDVVVPIAEGTDKRRVLDRGMVGHYAEEGVTTAMPDAKTGNFGLAGHRNTHGEPFRYINRLKPGDPIVVETQDTYFVYKMASILPVTAPSNTAVLDAIPKGAGFTKAGRYITLTTCTPEFTSKYRMIVWGTMVEERPRIEGKPDALVN